MSDKQYKFSFLVTRYKEREQWILYNWGNTENVTIDDASHPLYKVLESNNNEAFFSSVIFNDFHSDDLLFLLDKNFIVESDDEARRLVVNNYYSSTNSDNLELILMPANQACNFRCVYCYEDHSKKELMGDDEIKILKRFISKKESLESLSLDYFGGEPLLNKKFIIEFNSWAIKHCFEKNILFSSSMTTNGYFLSDDLFLDLHSCGVTNFQVTIDGVKSSHDKLRPLVNGKGTFDKVYNNLRNISKIPKSKKFIIIVRINFNDENSNESDVNNIINALKNDFEGDTRFIVNPHEIMNWKSEQGNSHLYMNKEDASERRRSILKKINDANLESFSAINYSGIESNSCYAGKSNSFVIYPAKKSDNKKYLPLQKCTVAISDSINDVGYIDENGDLNISKNISKWTSESPFRKEACKSCFFVLNCYGSSCPLNTVKDGYVKCPEEKYREVEIVKEIIDYINRN